MKRPKKKIAVALMSGAVCLLLAGCFSYHKDVTHTTTPAVEEPPTTTSSTTTTTTDNGEVQHQHSSSTYTYP